MNTQKAAVITALILIIGGLIGYRFYLEGNRYTIINGGAPGVAYQIDKKTGRTWMIRGAVKTEHVDNEALSQQLPIEEWHKVTGNAGFSWGGDSFYGKFVVTTEN